jgi:AcrR family transcriptional regulator
VARAAVEVGDRDGLAGLSLAKVADALQMTPTALYRYVDSKDVLVDLMIGEATGDPPALDGQDWRSDVRAWVDALYARCVAHPWLCDLTPQGMPRHPRAYAWIEALLAAVADVPGVDGMGLALLLDGLARGYASLSAAADDAGPPDWMRREIAARFTRLAEATARDRSTSAELRYAVDLVLRGLERGA